MQKTKHMNMANARHPEQIQKMKELQKDGVCLFCEKNFIKYQNTPIIREKKWWLMRNNDYPYDGAKIHILLVYKKHIDSVEKISPQAMTELLDHMQWAKKKFKIPGASFVMRFGDSRYTGSTITHLHAHIVSGYKNTKNQDRIISAVGFKK